MGHTAIEVQFLRGDTFQRTCECGDVALVNRSRRFEYDCVAERTLRASRIPADPFAALSRVQR